MSQEDASKLFVAGLPDSINEEVLRQLFEATGGTVVNVSLPKDRATGRPRGFGFVTLASPEQAQSARGELDGSLQAGRPISVRPFQAEPPRRSEGRSDAGPSPSSSSEDRTVYVGNLPYDISQDEVQALFADNGAGPVARVHLPVGQDGRPRGFGFVTLSTAEAASAAVTALRNVEVRGRRLMINIANPRGSGPSDRSPRPDRPRPPRRDESGEALEPRGERFAPSEPMPDPRMFGGGGGEESLEGRRARPGKKEKKKAKKGKGERQTAAEKRSRGGGASWQKWTDWDED
ncbi:MAG TPA: RNA-binding protein [Polyangiaceae bacterium]|nr:RNA-binding protein [Polyangiaceae bacterium]